MKAIGFAFGLALLSVGAVQADEVPKWFLDMRNCMARISISALEQGWGDNVMRRTETLLRGIVGTQVPS